MLKVSLFLVALSLAVVSYGTRAGATPPDVEVHDANTTGSLPKGVTISPDGRRLYVTNYGVVDKQNVAIYDTATLEVIHHVDVPGVVVESAVSPDGRTLYVSNFKRNSVQFIDLASRRVTREVKAGAHPKVLVVSSDGRRLFAANWGNASVSELDARTGAQVRTLRTEENPRGMAITKAGRLYVANFNSKSIDVFEGPEMKRRRRIKDVCPIPRHLTLSPDESKLYVSCLFVSQLAVLDTKTLEVVRRVQVGRGPKTNDVTRDGRYVVTADYRGSTVTVVDTKDWTTRVIDVPGMIAASGIVAARPARHVSAEQRAPKGRHAKNSTRDHAPQTSGYRTGETLRFFVTGWYDNHLYSVGLADGSPSYTVDRKSAELTLKRRNFFRAHPVQ